MTDTLRWRQLIFNGFQVQTDGRTVWVNGPNGANCGRFGPVGVDVHSLDADTHCEDCYARGAPDDWARFVAGISRVHGVIVPDDFKPEQ